MKYDFVSPQARRQRGAATLVVVMVLFLIMALLAAYANRSLMFEQRIAGSYYRASMAQEMAEASVEWTVAMLNGAAIDANCAPATVTAGGTRFVDRYFNVSTADRTTTSKVDPVVTARVTIAVDCASTGTGLVCRCPLPNTRTAQPSTALTGALIPSFGAGLGTDTLMRSGSFMIDAVGCTDSSLDSCTASLVEERAQRATATTLQKTSIAFLAAVPSSPAAPLTVKGSLVTAGAGGLGLHNTDPRSGGLLVVSGGPEPALNDDRMDSVPGTPAAQARSFNEPYLAGLTNSTEDKTRFFRNFMGMAPSRYPSHPAARPVTCPGDCGTTLVNAADAGTRLMTVPSAMAINTNVTIGSATAPVVVVVYGDVAINGPMQFNGMLVVLGDLHWVNAGAAASQVNGMVVVQGNMTTDGRMDVLYQQSIADELRNRLGSYVRVGGGWRDGGF